MAFHSKWFLLHIPFFEKVLKKYKNKPNLLFLEVGCYEGQATHWFLQNILTHSSSKITVVDTFEGSMEHRDFGDNTKNLLGNFKKNLSHYLPKINIVKGVSQEVIRDMGHKNMFDFVYVDASLVAKDAMEDYILCWRLLKKGGILVLSNYGWRIYKNPLLRSDLAINSFLRIFQGQYEILYMDYHVAISKKGDNVPIPKNIRKNTKNPIPENEIDELQLSINRLSSDLKKIQSARVYKIWQKYCTLRQYFKTGVQSIVK